MSFRNANIGVAVGLAVYVVGSLLTTGRPNNIEAMLIAVTTLGSAFAVCDYLSQRDKRLGRPPPPNPFRR
jgi:hypothetical protein